jgi:hypothetical protein
MGIGNDQEIKITGRIVSADCPASIHSQKCKSEEYQQMESISLIRIHASLSIIIFAWFSVNEPNRFAVCCPMADGPFIFKWN